MQMLLTVLIITLLNVGYYWERELTILATRRHLQSVISVWDGFEWYTWVAAVPAVLLLIRRFPLVRRQTIRSVAGLFFGGLAICLVVINVRYALRMIPGLWLPREAALPFDWVTYLHTQLVLAPIDFLTCFGLFATSAAVDYYIKYQRRTSESVRLQLRTAQLKSDLTRAQLMVLRGQLQPHFLFNAFNAISTLVRQRKNEKAVEMIAELSALLRLAMENAGCQEIALEQELEFVTHYLAIERVRFGDKLRVDVAIPPDTLPAIVPNLLLLPLAGNAIKHAISRRTTPGTVRIAAQHRGGRLVLDIIDDGPGDDPALPPAVSTGVGLANTRARLEVLYPSDYQLDLLPRPGGGMVVRLDLPWRTEPVLTHPAAIPV